MIMISYYHLATKSLWLFKTCVIFLKRKQKRAIYEYSIIKINVITDLDIPIKIFAIFFVLKVLSNDAMSMLLIVYNPLICLA